MYAWGQVVMGVFSDEADNYFSQDGDVRILSAILHDIEKTVIMKALERSGGNRVAAARMIGVHRNTLSSKIRKYSINVGGFKR